MRRLLKARELGLPEGDTSRWKEAPMSRCIPAKAGSAAAARFPGMTHDRCRTTGRSHIEAAGRHAAHPPHGGEVRRALRRQKIRGFLHLYIGEEAVRRRALHARWPQDDNVVATYREHGHALVRGVPMNA
jgi:hypothetical protein